MQQTTAKIPDTSNNDRVDAGLSPRQPTEKMRILIPYYEFNNGHHKSK